MTRNQSIYAAISKGAITLSQIAERCGITNDQARHALRLLRERKVVQCTECAPNHTNTRLENGQFNAAWFESQWAIVPGAEMPPYRYPRRDIGIRKGTQGQQEPAPEWSPSASIEMAKALGYRL